MHLNEAAIKASKKPEPKDKDHKAAPEQKSSTEPACCPKSI